MVYKTYICSHLFGWSVSIVNICTNFKSIWRKIEVFVDLSRQKGLIKLFFWSITFEMLGEYLMSIFLFVFHNNYVVDISLWWRLLYKSWKAPINILDFQKKDNLTLCTYFVNGLFQWTTKAFIKFTSGMSYRITFFII